MITSPSVRRAAVAAALLAAPGLRGERPADPALKRDLLGA